MSQLQDLKVSISVDNKDFSNGIEKIRAEVEKISQFINKAGDLISESFDLDPSRFVNGTKTAEKATESLEDALEDVEDATEEAFNDDPIDDFKDKTDEATEKSRKFEDTLKKVGKAIAGAFIVKQVISFGKAVANVGVEYNALNEQSEVTWTTLLGSQEAAIGQLERIEKFAASTPFSKLGVDSMAKYLHNAGYEGDAVFQTLTKIGDMGSAFGLQEESLVEMTRQFSQVQQAGYAYTEDLNILADRGIPIYQAIADEVGVTVAEVKKMASEGKLTSEIYNAAIDSMAETTEGAMEAQSKTFSGMMSTLQDNLTALAGLITEKLFNTLKGLLEVILPIVETFSNLYKETGSLEEALLGTLEAIGLESWVEFYNKVTDVWNVIKNFFITLSENETVLILLGIAVGTVTAAIVAFNAATIISKASLVVQNGLIWAMIAAETVATGVTTAFGVAVAFLTSPITLVILAIGALIAVIYLLVTNWDWVKEKGAQAWEWIKQKWSEACAWFTETILNPLKTGFDEFWRGVEEFGARCWDDIKAVWGVVCDWFNTTIINPVSSAFKSLGEGIKNFLTNPLEGIKSMFKSAFNWIIDKMNGVIGGLNKFQVPDWVPLIGGKGINIPSIPRLYKGSKFTVGGPTIVGENGPELVNMPRGASVLPAHKTASLFNNAQSYQPTTTQTANVIVELDGYTIAKAVGEPLMDTIRLRTGFAL